MSTVLSRGNAHWVNLDPRKGHEQGKMRPCLIVSPDILNRKAEWSLVTIVPLTSKGSASALRIPTLTAGRNGYALLAQVRSIDKTRLGALVDTVDPHTLDTILAQMRKFFS